MNSRVDYDALKLNAAMSYHSLLSAGFPGIKHHTQLIKCVVSMIGSYHHFLF